MSRSTNNSESKLLAVSHKLLAGILWLIANSLWLMACTSHQHPDKKIFHYNESSGLTSLDPVFAKNKQVMWMAHQLYNTLIEIDSNLQMKPSLATHWKISDDNLIFTFYLRNDVFFYG
jgi:oligopeptide transport system substrate-binding protein